MVIEDRVVSAIINEQFRRFKENNVLGFTGLDEELDRAAEGIGVRSLAELRDSVILRALMRNIEQSARYN